MIILKNCIILICVGWLSGLQSILVRAFSWASKARTFHTGASDMQPTVNSRLLLKSLSSGSRFFWNSMAPFFCFLYVSVCTTTLLDLPLCLFRVFRSSQLFFFASTLCIRVCFHFGIVFMVLAWSHRYTCFFSSCNYFTVYQMVPPVPIFSLSNCINGWMYLRHLVQCGIYERKNFWLLHLVSLLAPSTKLAIATKVWFSTICRLHACSSEHEILLFCGWNLSAWWSLVQINFPVLAWIR